MTRCIRTVIVAFVTGSMTASVSAATDFAKDIQPIFARHCYECHGPDLQKGNLRLDIRSESTGKVLVPGKSRESELYRRITLPRGHEDIMPSRGEPLSASQVATLRQWIDEGAAWPDNVEVAKHWAYVPPTRPELPKNKNRAWARNEIDRFVLAKLEKEKLRPSPEADREVLLRRVYLDLIGLAPSPRQVDAFLADKSAAAYEKVVNELLASPQYGERWARPWLDAARYADSSGFQRDNLWSLWPYRDWVINAFNSDKPFDQFTIEQIAGDLLPNATVEQKIATGFNRATATNIEAGSDQEETRVNQIFDRVNTVGTVWLGSTLECAQCHNHKYDPFTQKEYYELFAFFNNTPKETDKANPNATAALKFTGPYLDVPDPATDRLREEARAELEKIDSQINALTEKLQAAQPAWEAERLGSIAAPQVHLLQVADFKCESDSLHEILEDGSILVRTDDNGTVPNTDTYTFSVQTTVSGISGFKLEALTHPSLPGNGPGRGDEKRPNFVLTEFRVSALVDGTPQAVKLRNARASFGQKNFPAANAIDGNDRTGWAIAPEFFTDHWAVFETSELLGSEKGLTLTFKLGQDNGAGRIIGRFRLSALTGKPNANGVPAGIPAILATARDKRTKTQERQLTDFYLSQQPELTALKTGRVKAQKRLKELQSPQTLVMQELAQPRMSSLFARGNFLEPGQKVEPGVPAILHPLPDGPRNRLTLAQWLASRNNPLVARVTVNRWWTEIFGHGLVTTPEDFGIKGEPPTHPELLDWLATEFMESGWSMKHMHRLIVTSATYRQAGQSSEKLLQRDDQNKLYARGPRFRMDAEMIRDNALAAAGLLSLKAGGPPVRPYQPPGIWESKVGGDAITYEISEGQDRYRRGVYTVWKRTSPYPSFITFDAPTRNSCVVRRARSNTPLQALTLLNDPVYTEAAKALVKRVAMDKPSAPIEERIRYAFQLCTSRQPKSSELRILLRLYEEQSRASKDNPAVEKLGDASQRPPGMSASEFAAWYSVATALLNLDETITKG